MRVIGKSRRVPASISALSAKFSSRTMTTAGRGATASINQQRQTDNGQPEARDTLRSAAESYPGPEYPWGYFCHTVLSCDARAMWISWSPASKSNHHFQSRSCRP